MARKLNSEEARVFDPAWPIEGPLYVEIGEDVFLQRLRNQRDAALSLSPELNHWFGEAFWPRRATVSALRN